MSFHGTPDDEITIPLPAELPLAAPLQRKEPSPP
jgi:hypothetical protein